MLVFYLFIYLFEHDFKPGDPFSLLADRRMLVGEEANLLEGWMVVGVGEKGLE